MTAPQQPATPTPWKVHLGDWDGPKILADDAGECLIATVEPENTIPEHAEADARYIVHAVNRYDALVQAAEGFMRWMDDAPYPQHRDPRVQRLYDSAANALALARGTEGADTVH